MESFDAIRILATTLGVSAPESNDDIYNVNFINSINRSAKRVFKDFYALHDKNKAFTDALANSTEKLDAVFKNTGSLGCKAQAEFNHALLADNKAT